MKRELGIARCGLACCLCSENDKCDGCGSGECPDRAWCENRRCSIERGISGCRECKLADSCSKGLLAKTKPRAFNEFVMRYGISALLDCLERNESAGVRYHVTRVSGDYDDPTDVEETIEFIRTGKK